MYRRPLVFLLLCRDIGSGVSGTDQVRGKVGVVMLSRLMMSNYDLSSKLLSWRQE